MKNKIFYILVVIGFTISIKAQVGINTNNPQGIVQIDGAKDNSASGNPTQNQLYNDVVIQNNANIGIGSLPEDNARVNISVNTAIDTQIGKGFRLKDGTEGDGNLLSLINPQGDVSWKKRIGTVRGTFGTGFNGSINSDMVFTTTTINLPPGKWLIRSSIILRVQSNNGTYSDGLFSQLSWADLNTDGTYSLSADAESGNLFGGAYLGMYSLAFGQTIINNSTNATKTYYLVTRKPKVWGTSMASATWQSLAGNVWGENAIIAFSAN